jgi:penicillin-binding protein 1B
LQAALVALDPRSGEILAMVGGRDYGRSQFNRAVDAHRQPGSAFKPVVALTALAEPRGDQDGSVPEFTLASTLRDEPLTVETPAGPWQPVNYDGRYRGELTLRDALERSLNVPFARLGVAVGAERIVATARDLGITSPLRPYPSIALGAFEVTPLELTRAYGVFAAQGYRAEQHAALAVIDRSGEVLRSAESNGEQVYTPAEAYLVTSALQGAVQRGTGQGLRSLGVRSTVAAKSGTTNDFRDGWFIAYTPSLVVGVWVGFDDGQSLGAPGSRVALPIVGRFLAEALDEYGNEDFPIPSGVEIVDVDPETGLRGGPGCWGEPEVFLRGTAPERSCSPYWASSRRSRSSSRVVDDLRRLWDELRQLLDREH